jgi:ATP-dependent protease HslVU (ClpYQ) peptidase subunit
LGGFFVVENKRHRPEEAMTVLAAFQGDGFAVIGADSRASDYGGRVMVLSNRKVVWDEYENYLFAITGATRGGNLIQQGWTPPTPPVWQGIDELDKFMTRDFIPQLRELFVDAGYEGVTLDGASAQHDTNFLVAVQGIIYPIMEDYSWDRDTRNIYYNGSGGDVALGTMVGLGIDKCKSDPKKAKAIIKKAVEAACAWNAFCAAPVIIETQYTKA